MNISKDLNTAIFKSILGKYSAYIIQIVSLMVLSRIFSPDEFGLVVIIQVVIVFFQFVVSSSLSPALVYCDSLTNRDRDGIFTCSLIIAFISFFALFLLSSSFSNYFNVDSIFFVLVSFSCFFVSLSMLPIAAMQKDRQFYKMAVVEVISEIGSLFLVFYTYFYTSYSEFSLVLRVVVNPVIRFLFYYYYSGLTSIGRPLLGGDIKAIKLLFDFSIYQFLFNLFAFFSRNIDSILMAKYFGLNSVGLYDKTYQLMKYPLQLFSFAVNPAIQPTLTKYQNNPVEAADAYFKVLLKLSFLGLFSAFVLHFFSKSLLIVIFGEQWKASAIYLEILSLSIPVQMVMATTGGAFQAFGKTKLMFKCGLFGGCCNIFSIIIGIYYLDLEVLCYLLSLSYLLAFFQCYFVVSRKLFKIGFGFLVLCVPLIVFIPYSLYFFDFGGFFEYDSLLGFLFVFCLFSTCLILFLTLIYFLLLYFKGFFDE